jgi:predicted esterase
VLATVLTSCGGSGGNIDPSADPAGSGHTSGSGDASGTAGPPYAVSSEVIAGPGSHDLRVWAPHVRAPAESGRWPVVYAVPGSGGHKGNFDLLGPALARRGLVVFATDYRSTSTDAELTADLECGYRFVRRVANDHGGDLHEPVALVGYSRGARAVFSLLDERRLGPGGTFDACSGGAPSPDVVVAAEGCYYAFAGETHVFPPVRPPTGTRFALVSGLADDVCPTWQSRKAAATLRAEGYDTTLVTVPGADHHAPIFRRVVAGRTVADPHEPAGKRLVRAVLDAVRADR